MLAFRFQSPSADPVACSWEYGGVPEAVPAPCADASLTRVAGAGTFVAGVGLLLAVFACVLLLGILVQARRAA